MARTKGTANLAASLEVLAGAPLDSRTVVPTVADLTVAANFPYKYVGMPVVVQATGDMYILTANDVTVPANWKKNSGSGGSGGHTIEDNGTAMTARAGLNFTDFDVSDDSTNDETDVKAHRLTAEELEDIIYKVPSLANISQLGTEAMIFSTSEKAVGQWTDGKILYAKTVDCGAFPNNSIKNVAHNISNVDKIWVYTGYAYNPTTEQFVPLQFPNDSVSAQWNCIVNKTYICISTFTNRNAFSESYVTVLYTKTTDTALASGEKYAGLTSSGEVVYERTVTGNAASSDSSSATLVTISDIDSIVSASGMIKCSNSDKRAVPNMASSIEQVGTDVRFYCNSSSMYGKPVTVTVRYTKTS